MVLMFYCVRYSLLAAAVDRGDVGVVRALAGSGKADVNGSGANRLLPLVRALRHNPFDAFVVQWGIMSTLLCDSPPSPCRDGMAVIKFTKSRKLPRHC